MVSHEARIQSAKQLPVFLQLDPSDFWYPAHADFDLIVGLNGTFHYHSSTHHVFSYDPWPTMVGFSLGLRPRIADNSDLC